jgi:MGT family glycosyltransferase
MMVKIVFSNIPGHGHVNPTLPVVAELVKQGHQVIYYNTEDFRPQIERTGAEFRPYPSVLTADEITEAVNRSLVHVPVLVLRWSETLTGYMMDELQRERPDLVMYDSICLWGMQSARVLKLPSISSITTLVLEGVKNQVATKQLLHLLRSALPLMPALVSTRRRLLKRYGKDSLPKNLFPAVGDLNIVYTSTAFQPPSTFIDERFRFVGPSIQPTMRTQSFPFEQLTRKPVIYISLGTIHNADTNFYQQCYEAFADFPGQFILSAGKTTDLSSLPPAPANFIVRGSVPQLEVLQHVDLFITHGGINSVQEGLYYGVPLVIIPRQLEQAINGRQVVTQRAGIMLGSHPPYGRTKADELRAAVDTVLSNSSYREAAKRIGQSFRNAGGYLQAVQEIEGFIRGLTTSAV